MPWHGNHGWESHLDGLRTKHENGNLTDASYAKALRRFALKYEERAAREIQTLMASGEHDRQRARWLHDRADQLDGGPDA